MLRNENDEEDRASRKKGFKALWKKMKPKASREPSGWTDPTETRSRAEYEATDYGARLAPPPPIPHLMGKKGRDRSGSLSSVQTDISTFAFGGKKRNSLFLPPGLRSVSTAREGSSPGDNLNVSPRSSRFVSSAPRPDSFASLHGRERRRSSMANELGDDDDGRGSAMEILSNRKSYASPEPSSLFEEPSAKPRGGAPSAPAHLSPHVATYPPPTARLQIKTPSSLSASTDIETPPAIPTAAPFFDHRTKGGEVLNTANANHSPNRYKNLPPLPSGGQDAAPYSASPDSFAAALPEHHVFIQARNDRSPRYNGRTLAAPAANFGYPQSPVETYGYQVSRSSFDYGDRPTRRDKEISPRTAHSMYVHPSAAGSKTSFGRFMGVAGLRQESGTTIDLSDDTSVKGKKGLKGFFGRA